MYRAFELIVFLLLVANAVIFAVDGTVAEGLDSAAWLTLLLLFMLETGHPELFVRPGVVTLVRGLRLVAGAVVAVAAVGYIRDGAWLDVANAWLWIAVVCLLEFKVRCGRRFVFWTESVAVVLYLGLVAVLFAWAWRGEWFDAYDAALWLVAFATIEMNVLKAFRTA